MLLLVMAMMIMSTMTVSAHNIDCPTCGHPNSCHVCRGAYQLGNTVYTHKVGAWNEVKETCYYRQYTHAHNIKCPFNHVTYTANRHLAGTDAHSLKCPRTYGCSGVGTVVF